MSLIHDEIAEKILLYFIEHKTFGNRYLASKIPIFPKPDIILLGLSKDPQPQIAFELKPPHAVKREYLTGLGQAISYLMKFPLVYIILPDEKIDGIDIPVFITEIIEKCDLKVGVISYNIADYQPTIRKEAILEKNIDIENLEKEITSLKPRSWLFWMDTKIEEVAAILKKITEVENRNIKGSIIEIVLEEIWDEVLKFRYTNATRPASFKLNYKLFLDTMNLWDGNGNLTVLGHRLYEISKKYGGDSNEFRDALHYVILTEGGYLKMLILIDKIQRSNDFGNKGSTTQLNSIIRKLRDKMGVTGRDYDSEKEKILQEYEKSAPNSWLKVVGIELFKKGLGRSLTQINEELARRFGSYFQNSLKTNFYIENQFIKDKGYIINWERIISLIERGQEIIEVF